MNGNKKRRAIHRAVAPERQDLKMAVKSQPKISEVALSVKLEDCCRKSCWCVRQGHPEEELKHCNESVDVQWGGKRSNWHHGTDADSIAGSCWLFSSRPSSPWPGGSTWRHTCVGQGCADWVCGVPLPHAPRCEASGSAYLMHSPLLRCARAQHANHAPSCCAPWRRRCTSGTASWRPRCRWRAPAGPGPGRQTPGRT